MKAKIKKIVVGRAKNGKRFYSLHLDNDSKATAFSRDMCWFEGIDGVLDPIQRGNLHDHFSIEPPLSGVFAENDKGFLHLHSLEANPDAIAVLEGLSSKHDTYIEWCKTSALEQIVSLSESPYTVVFDLETTGFDNKRDEIVSIGISSLHDGIYALVKPSDAGLKRNISNGAYKVHGLTEDKLADAKSFTSLYGFIYNQLASQVWVCYNADFDVPFLDNLCERHDVPRIPRLGVHCMMKLYAQYAGQLNQRGDKFKNHKLTQACADMKVTLSNAHNALADAEATYDLIEAIADSY